MVQSSFGSGKSSAVNSDPLDAERISGLLEWLSDRYPYLSGAPGVRPFDPVRLSTWALDLETGSTRADRVDATAVWILLGLAEDLGLYEETSDDACALIRASLLRPDALDVVGLADPVQLVATEVDTATFEVQE